MQCGTADLRGIDTVSDRPLCACLRSATHGVPFAPCVHLPYSAHHVATWHMLQRDATRCNAMQLVAPRCLRTRWGGVPSGLLCSFTLGMCGPAPVAPAAHRLRASLLRSACMRIFLRSAADGAALYACRTSQCGCTTHVVSRTSARCTLTRYMSSVACRPLHVVAGLTGWQEPELDESDAEEPADGAPHPSSAPFAHHCGLDWPTVRICAGADLTAPCGPSQIRPPRPPTPPRQPSFTRTRRRSRFWSTRLVSPLVLVRAHV